MIGGDESVTPVGGEGFERIDDAIPLNIDRISRFEEDVYIESYITNKEHVYGDH
jgi:diaminohydroxyphosphoribosylaminopyrimidine deaminase/5-amino-6-(5-phosphoribosylamino)uracil reductase